MKERFKIVPAVYLILMKDGKILLARRYNTGYFDGYYSFPAGHLDGGETLKQAMVREAKEETGLVLDPSELELAHTINRMITPGNERVDFFFTTKNWQGVPKITEPDKCDDLDWFEINNLPQNITPYVKKVIDCLLKNINYSELVGEERLPAKM